MVGVVAVVLCSVGLLVLMSRAGSQQFARYAAAALAIHLVCAFAQYWVQESFYGITDTHGFAMRAEPIAMALDLDFERFAPEVVKMAVHLDPDLPGVPPGPGDANSTMVALTASLFWFVGAPSLEMAYVVVTCFMWGANLLFAKVFAEEVQEDERGVAYIASLLVPSVVYWSSAIVKEAFVIMGLYLVCFAVHRTLVRRSFWYLPIGAVGAVAIAMIKPYVLFPLVLAFAAWVYVARLQTISGGRRAIRLGPLVIATLLALAGLVVVSTLFPEYGLDKIGERTAQQQDSWIASEEIQVKQTSVVNITAPTSRSLLGQIPYIPLAIVDSFFRPFIFEVRNLTMLAASLETTVLLFVSARTLWRFRFSGVRDALLRSPLLSGSLTFVLLFGLAVGLATGNLGSLSRYRIPMMPFYVLVVALLSRRLGRTAPKLAMRGAGVSATGVNS